MHDSTLCSHCLQPLIYIPFPKYYRLVCDKDLCPLFREGQGNVERDDGNEPGEKPKGLPSARVLTQKYQASLVRGKENYHFATSLGIPSVVARDLRTKSKAKIKRAAKELVRA